MTHLGDIAPGEEVNFKFTTVDSTGLPTALASGVISVYKDNNLTQSTAGITLTVSFDGVTGLNHVNITTISDAAFYIDRASYSAVITAGTVGGVSVVGYVVAQWKMRQTIAEQVWGQSVGALGNVSDSFASAVTEMWNRIGSLLDVAVSTRSDQSTANRIEEDTQNIQGRLPSDLISGRMDSHTGSVADGVYEFDKFAESFWQGLADRVWGASVGVYGLISDSFGGAVAEMWSRLFALLDVAVSTRASATALSDVQSDTNDIQTRLPAALVSGRMDASVGAMQADVLTAAATAADFATEINTGMATAAAVAAVQSDVDDVQSRLPAALIGGRMASHVEAISDGVLSEPKFTVEYFDAIVDRVWGQSVATFAGVSDSYGQIINDIRNELENVPGEVWDVTLSAHLAAGSTGSALNAAGAAGDPWSTTLPGAYGAGTAGFIVGTNLDATVSSRASAASLAAAQADLDNIQTRLPDGLVGGRMDSHVGSVANGVLSFSKFSQDYWDGVTAYVWTVSVGANAQVSDSFAGALAEVWNRTSSLLDVAISTRLAAASYTAPLDAAGTRSAVGLASANLDTQLDALPTAAENADAVWDEAIAGHLSAGSTGAALNSAGGGSTPDQIAAAVWGYSVGLAAPVSDSFGQAVSEIWNKSHFAGDVWDVILTAHLTAGSTGFALNAAGAAGDPWSTSLPGAYGVGTAGFIVGTNVNATISSRAVPGDAMDLVAGAVDTVALSSDGVDEVAASVWGYSVGLGSGASDSFGQAVGEMWNRIDVNVGSRSSHSASDVWSVSTRLLTAGTNIALAKGTGVTGFNDLSAADVRAAVGLASANLDTQLDGLPTAVENADALLARNIAGGSNGGRDVTSALRILRNRMLISGSTLTVYQEDDMTPSWTSVLATDAAAVPIVGSDPA